MTYVDVLENVLNPAGCMGCHSFSHAFLTTESYTCAPNTKRYVKAGSPAESYVYVVIAPEFDASPERCTPKMPEGGSLSTEQVALVRKWIEQGALP